MGKSIERRTLCANLRIETLIVMTPADDYVDERQVLTPSGNLVSKEGLPQQVQLSQAPAAGNREQRIGVAVAAEAVTIQACPTELPLEPEVEQKTTLRVSSFFFDVDEDRHGQHHVESSAGCAHEGSFVQCVDGVQHVAPTRRMYPQEIDVRGCHASATFDMEPPLVKAAAQRQVEIMVKIGAVTKTGTKALPDEKLCFCLVQAHCNEPIRHSAGTQTAPALLGNTSLSEGTMWVFVSPQPVTHDWMLLIFMFFMPGELVGSVQARLWRCACDLGFCCLQRSWLCLVLTLSRAAVRE